MRPAALKLTRISLLRNIARAQDQSLTALAERVAMDRTTLTRNLRPLQRDGLIVLGQGRDARSRVVAVTPAGFHRLEAALPYWREAERLLRARLGTERSRDLHALLGELTEV
jgi:DNA-binding MarR family transcriptional regulator